MIINEVLTKATREPVRLQAPQRKHLDKTSRSLAKTISWRAIGTIDTILISWLITGTLKVAFSIGAIELITKMILYFFHERTWNYIPYGRQY